MTDNSTLDFYNQHADAYIKQTRQVDMHALYDAFVGQLPTDIKRPHHILDIGLNRPGIVGDSIF